MNVFPPSPLVLGMSSNRTRIRWRGDRSMLLFYFVSLFLASCLRGKNCAGASLPFDGPCLSLGDSR